MNRINLVDEIFDENDRYDRCKIGIVQPVCAF